MNQRNKDCVHSQEQGGNGIQHFIQCKFHGTSDMQLHSGSKSGSSYLLVASGGLGERNRTGKTRGVGTVRFYAILLRIFFSMPRICCVEYEQQPLFIANKLWNYKLSKYKYFALLKHGRILSLLVITLYKGLPLFSHNLHVQAVLSWTSGSPIFNWTLGCVFILGHCLSWSGWIVLQVPVLKRYPARLSVISLTCVFGLLQFLVIAAFTEEDLSRWKVRSGGELFTILYAGLVASGVAFALKIWCIDRGGPLFTSVFQPVQTVTVAVMAAVILGDQLYTGGIIGAVLIVIGLYFVLWGKSEEKKTRSLQDPRWRRSAKTAARRLTKISK